MQALGDRKIEAARVRRNPRDYSEVMRGLSPSRNPLGQFIAWPRHYCVEIQQKEEEILLLVRKHWLTNIKWILIVLGLVIAGMFLPQLPLFGLIPLNFQFMTRVIWYLITTAVALEGFFDWYFDTFVITDERIIDIDFSNLVYKNITATKIDKIEDVTYNISGAVNSIFNFGTVLVQTAGTGMRVAADDTQGTIEIINVPNPAMVAKLINEMVLEEEQEQIEGRVR